MSGMPVTTVGGTRRDPSVRVAGQERRQRRELDALVGERLRFLAGRLAANRARRNFVVMDLARLVRKFLADVFGVAHDVAQLRDEVGGETGDRLLPGVPPDGLG